jgi:hypothetical protein
MKNSTMRWMFAAAALVVAAGSASAQTYKAEIPMAFRMGAATLEKGSYQFHINDRQSNLIKVTNLATNRSVLVVPQGAADAPKHLRRASTPTIGFECVGTTCAMTRLSGTEGELSYRIPVRKLPVSEARRTDVVTVALTKVR